MRETKHFTFLKSLCASASLRETSLPHPQHEHPFQSNPRAETRRRGGGLGQMKVSPIAESEAVAL